MNNIVLGYKLSKDKPVEGDYIYSIRWKSISKVRKLADGKLVYAVPGFKMCADLCKLCVKIVPEQGHMFSISRSNYKQLLREL